MAHKILYPYQIVSGNVLGTTSQKQENLYLTYELLSRGPSIAATDPQPSQALSISNMRLV
ncbi:hypothetical protein KIN20_031941 [Parelaphostrongylus tenuis]|uniref:Uncharacterized protein n=1 Tax=Parelaphostrongylus tenuis TaxID=148309 RepID=A0AAD5WHD0_PARTN|nr:hypothetical protein KIN20_031941 [Parelaphostrongylus tenuis]